MRTLIPPALFLVVSFGLLQPLPPPASRRGRLRHCRRKSG